jgi:hypothetical protein
MVVFMGVVVPAAVGSSEWYLYRHYPQGKGSLYYRSTGYVRFTCVLMPAATAAGAPLRTKEE